MPATAVQLKTCLLVVEAAPWVGRVIVGTALGAIKSTLKLRLANAPHVASLIAPTQARTRKVKLPLLVKPIRVVVEALPLIVPEKTVACEEALTTRRS